MTQNLNNLTINENSTIKQAMFKITKNKKGIVFVYRDKAKYKKIIGTLTDGDIRASLLLNSDLNQKITKIINKNFKFFIEDFDRENFLKLLDQGFKVIPILSKSGRLIKILDKVNPLKEKKFIIRSRSPVRISLAGGGTDLTKFFFNKGGSGISFTVNKHCNVSLIKRKDTKIKIHSQDFNKSIEFSSLDKIKYDGNLDIVKASIKILNPDFGFDIFVETDVKPGSGLGSSAAVASSIIGAINYLQARKLTKYEVAEYAFQVERIELGILGGWQDQYSTVFGGCNIMEFKKDQNLIHNIKLPNNVLDELERRLLICDTKIPHKGSALQLRNSRSAGLIKYGEEIKKIVDYIKSDLLKGNVENLGNLIQKTWDLKKNLDKKMSNNKIKNLEKKLCGPKFASGCRLLGTGGGGYMLFYVEPINRFNLINRMKMEGIEYYSVKFDTEGLKVWETEYS